MVITKREDVTKQGSCKILWRKLRLRGSLLLVLIQCFWCGVGVVAYLSLAFKMGAYSRWALIRGWALIRINTVVVPFSDLIWNVNLKKIKIRHREPVWRHFVYCEICGKKFFWLHLFVNFITKRKIRWFKCPTFRPSRSVWKRCVTLHSEGMTKVADYGAVFLRGECR